MPVRQTSVGVGSIAGSSTFFPHVPVELDRSRGVATLTLIANGTSGASSTNPAATTNERNNLAAGLTVTLAASGGVYTTVTINAAGANYAEGDVILVPLAAGTPALKLIVSTVTALGGVTGIGFLTNTTSGASAAGPLATVCEEPRTGAQGLTVNATAAAGVVTTLAVVGAGRGYRIGDIVTITVTGATTPVTASVATITG
jgi:hypothetical protein